jgi:hypothetical protein
MTVTMSAFRGTRAPDSAFPASKGGVVGAAATSRLPPPSRGQIGSRRRPSPALCNLPEIALFAPPQQGMLRRRRWRPTPFAPDGPAEPDRTVPGPKSRRFLSPYCFVRRAHGREHGKKRPRSPPASRQGPARRRKTVSGVGGSTLVVVLICSKPCDRGVTQFTAGVIGE